MSSKFLSSAQTGSLSALQDGTFVINVAEATIQDATPNLPLRTNGDKKIVSGLIQVSDINASIVLNPFIGTLKASDFETDNYLSAEAEFKQIEHITNQGSVPNITGVAGTLKADDLKTDTISDAGGNVFIQMDATDINFSFTNLTWNGSAIGGGGGVQNPMVADLNCANFNLLNVGATGVNLDTFVVATGTITSTLTGDMTIQQTKTQNITGSVFDTIFTGQVNVGDLLVKSINTSTRLITQASDFGAPSGNFYVMDINTNYRIHGVITMAYGIQFATGCSLSGDGLNSVIIFDEQFRDCQLKSIKGQQVLISDLSISNGGGRFSQLSTKGLFDCVDINTAPASVAPFYERFRRFYMNNVFFSTVYNIGFIQGFSTISINNCIFDGGAVFTLAPELYYTNYGITLSSGLSCELNNCKFVLFRGSLYPSTSPMITLGSNVVILATSVGFNAVEISDNIIHPRGTEKGLFVAEDCTTKLGNIGNNVFISETATKLLTMERLQQRA
jgi:hypothetical protein